MIVTPDRLRARLPIVGVTGGAAVGKTAFAEALAARGGVIVSGDDMGRRAVETSIAVRRSLIRRFGGDIRGRGNPGNCPIDRKALAARAFADDESTAALNAIVHPRLLRLLNAEVDRRTRPRRMAHRFVIIDAALLAEWWDRTEWDCLIAVWSPRADRVRRLRDRGYSPATIDALFRRQMPFAQHRRFADFVVRNDAGLDKLARRARAISKRLAIGG